MPEPTGCFAARRSPCDVCRPRQPFRRRRRERPVGGDPVPPREVGGRRTHPPRELGPVPVTRSAMTDTTTLPVLELLPAVDVADGRAVQLVQGVAGSGGEFGDPVGRRAGLAGAGLAVASPRRPRRGLRPGLQRRPPRRDRRPARHRRRDERRDPRRRARWTGPSRRGVDGSTSAPPHSRTRSGPRGPSPSTATGSPSASTCAAPPLAARGWTTEGGDLWETLTRLDAEGCSRYVVTDVAKDGMLQGPNLALLADVCARTDRPVVASGGVSTLADIAAIRELVPVGRGGCHRRLGPLPGRVHPPRGARRRRVAREPGRGARGGARHTGAGPQGPRLPTGTPPARRGSTGCSRRAGSRPTPAPPTPVSPPP